MGARACPHHRDRKVRVVYKVLAVFAVWRQVAGRRLLEALDDRRLTAAVLADDDGEGLVELEDLRLVGRVGPDPLDLQLLDRRHRS
jgi:hypothetical protein